jgi:RHS repeat-associated protein
VAGSRRTSDGSAGLTFYFPYGDTLFTTDTNANSEYRYTGQRRDQANKIGQMPIGLYFYGSRYFDPVLGRFVSPDSIIPEASQGVQAWDRYAGMNNNPVVHIDPSGHWSITIGYNVSSFTNILFDLIGISGSDVVNNLDTIATLFDTAALAIDSSIAAGDIASAAIGATAGAGFALPEGGAPAVFTGPTGALIGMGLFEITPEVRIGIVTGNIIASASTALTTLSDIISGETNDVRAITLSDNGLEYFHFTVVGRDTLTSGILSTAGWMSPIGLTSAPLQGAALLNDLDKLYIGPLSKLPKRFVFRQQWVKVGRE